MIEQDVEYIKNNKNSKEIFSLVDRYAKEGCYIFNGGISGSNVTDGKNHISTASLYRLWEYTSLIELCGLTEKKNQQRAEPLKILDCGGCSSAIDFFLAERGFCVYSIDLNDFLVHNGNFIAKKKKLTLKNVCADFTSLPFENNNFDIVFSISVMEHIDNDLRIKAIREMERVVKPGGYIYNTFDYGDSRDKKINYNIPSSYQHHRIIKSIDEINDLIKCLDKCTLIGNMDLKKISSLSKISPNSAEFLMYVDLKTNFTAFSNLKEVGIWLYHYLLFKISPSLLQYLVYKNPKFYNFFRLLLQKGDIQ
jgi:SAM-dependent methyltransferase